MKTALSLALTTLILSSVTIGAPILPALETLSVSSDGTVEQSTVILEEGVQYWILAEGTYSQGGTAENRADAEFSHEPYYEVWDWYEYRLDSSCLDLLVNGQDIDWRGSSLDDPDPIAHFGTFAPHTFSPSHMYWFPIVGDGNAVSLMIQDSVYGDNSGSLTASIYPVPEPGTLSLLSLAGMGLFSAWRRR
ncbi:MAG: PEP-CTERM sorting domain-containing protein [Phycisphaerae bacterium]|nr:PEP-CTERM sorting domain-containing protein [Phycisphaerae bacterium]